MNFKKIISLLQDDELLLFELLKVKKNLERVVLETGKHQPKISLKSKLISFLVIKKINVLFKNDYIYLISLIEVKLYEGFKNYKKRGEFFDINGLASVNKDFVIPELSKLIKYNKSLEEFGANLIIQGSYADQTQTDYSDFDFVIIGELNKEVAFIKKQLETDILSFDPLQHHGVFFINKNSLTNLWQMDLPISTLKKAIVRREHSLSLEITSVFIEKYSSFFWLKSFTETFSSFPLSLESGVFFSKNFTSQLLLVPTMLLAFKGNYIYKKDSFSLAKEYYTREAWDCILIATALRKFWDKKNIDTKSYEESRSSLTDKDVFEFNFLSEVSVFAREDIAKFKNSYKRFILETQTIID